MKPAFTHKGKPFSFAHVRSHWRKNKAEMMPVIGQVAVNFFVSRFRAQAWTDRYAKKWDKRKKPDKGKRRAILVRSRKLRDSIKVKSLSTGHVTIGSNISYAAAHNFGFKGRVSVKQHTRRINRKAVVHNIETRRKSRVKVTVGAVTVKRHSRKMDLPQRQFMGNSHAMSMKFERIIIKSITKSLKQ